MKQIYTEVIRRDILRKSNLLPDKFETINEWKFRITHERRAFLKNLREKKEETNVV